MDHADVVVIGAGLAGSATARALGRRGAGTILLEQFEIGHARGSSHGPARVFRLAYPQPDYVRLAERAERAWRELEAEAGEQLLVTTGGLYGGGWTDDCAGALEACGVSYEWLAAGEAQERFPAMGFEGLERVLWQQDGGVCLAAKTVAAQVRAAAAAGVDVRAETPVLRLRAARDGVEIETPEGTVRCGACVVAAGAYAGPLLEQVGIVVPLAPVFAQVTYFQAACDAVESPPSYVEAASAGGGLAEGGYWVPSVDGSPVVRAGDGAPGAPLDPRDAPFAVDPEEEGWVSAFIRRRLPSYDPAPARSETCIYTMTPDGDFLLDRHGPIVIASACSGHGFKFGPLLGEIVADLATGAVPDIPVSRFGLGRFVP